MEELDNKTIMCSVFFLDIVGYSKKSVTGQISLKDRFNSYLSAAIRDVPITDRIILDTGDGAAINFLGDIEDALKAALSLRESLLNEDPNVNHPLLVRMGINLGPVRLVRDINGQPNIVGDGINVAQRVMGFADASQVLVSRSYFDAVSRLSPQYAEMFHYQGSRTDKHVREHEVYAIGYPGEKTVSSSLAKKSKRAVARAMDSTRTGLRPAVLSFKSLQARLMQGFWQAGPVKRGFYVAAVVIILLLIFELTEEKLFSNVTPTILADNKELVTSLPQSKPVFAPAMSASVPSSLKTNESIPVQPGFVFQPEKQKNAVKKKPKEASPLLEPEHKINMPETPVMKEVVVDNMRVDEQPAGRQDTKISVTCKEGAEVFIDGARKGKVGASPLVLPISPGRHLVIVNHDKGMDSQNILFAAGKTVHVNPEFCNR
jgi:hypothetical protein